ncbi:hypothetical protein LTR84_006327 [Exophiala bonariae]|uniref:BTB domain-containing protein n=1 Tax=Exophiala bonariae TaxID=1690606 RepID=A0AAV9N330_9EURO|nr:hypothetical protein LTR84_006327 [Exophiala bonariae]
MSSNRATENASSEETRQGEFKGVGYVVEEEIYQANLPLEELVLDPRLRSPKSKQLMNTPPLVTIHVGREAKMFSVHNAILEQRTTNVNNPAEDDPQAMWCLIRFLYTNSLPYKDVGEASCDGPFWIRSSSCIIALWMLADKYHVQWLRHEMVDVCLAAAPNTTDVKERHFEELRELGLYDTAIWDLFADIRQPRQLRCIGQAVVPHQTAARQYDYMKWSRNSVVEPSNRYGSQIISNPRKLFLEEFLHQSSYLT